MTGMEFLMLIVGLLLLVCIYMVGEAVRRVQGERERNADLEMRVMVLETALMARHDAEAWTEPIMAQLDMAQFDMTEGVRLMVMGDFAFGTGDDFETALQNAVSSAPWLRED